MKTRCSEKEALLLCQSFSPPRFSWCGLDLFWGAKQSSHPEGPVHQGLWRVLGYAAAKDRNRSNLSKDEQNTPDRSQDVRMKALVSNLAGILGLLLAPWIVFNAAAYAFSSGEAFLGILEVAFFPVTVFLWPFVAPSDAFAWPLAAGTSMIWAVPTILVCGVLAGMDD